MNLKLADSITINWYRFTLLCTLNCNWVHVSLYLNVLARRKIWGRLGFVPTIIYRKASSLWKCPSFFIILFELRILFWFSANILRSLWDWKAFHSCSLSLPKSGQEVITEGEANVIGICSGFLPIFYPAIPARRSLR